MLSEKAIKLLVFINNLGWYWGCLHYKFVKNDKKGYVVEKDNVKNWKTFRFYYLLFGFVVSCSYGPFILLRLIYTLNYTADDPRYYQVHSDPSFKRNFVVKMLYYTFAYSSLIYPLVFFRFHRYHELPLLLGSTTEYFKVFGALKAPRVESAGAGDDERRTFQKRSNDKPFIVFSYVCIFTLVVFVLQNFSILKRHPELPHHLTSLFEEPKQIPIFFKVPIYLVHIYVWAPCWIWSFETIIPFMYCYFTCCILKLEEVDDVIKHKKFGFRTPVVTETIVSNVRSMQTLHRFWANTFENSILPFLISGWMTIGTLAIYGIVKYSGVTAFKVGITALVGGFFLKVALKLCARLHDSSSEMLKKWKGMQIVAKSRYLSRFLRSVKGFQVNIGGTFLVENNTVLTVFEVIADNAVQLILL